MRITREHKCQSYRELEEDTSQDQDFYTTATKQQRSMARKRANTSEYNLFKLKDAKRKIMERQAQREARDNNPVKTILYREKERNRKREQRKKKKQNEIERKKKEEDEINKKELEHLLNLKVKRSREKIRRTERKRVDKELNRLEVRVSSLTKTNKKAKLMFQSALEMMECNDVAGEQEQEAGEQEAASGPDSSLEDDADYGLSQALDPSDSIISAPSPSTPTSYTARTIWKALTPRSKRAVKRKLLDTPNQEPGFKTQFHKDVGINLSIGAINYKEELQSCKQR